MVILFLFAVVTTNIINADKIFRFFIYLVKEFVFVKWKLVVL